MSLACGHDQDHCSAAFTGQTRAYRRTLWVVIAINAAMFAVEMTAGLAASSMALRADALDFLGDSLTYGLSLFVLGMPLVWRARAAMLKGVSLALMGLWVLADTGWRVFVLETPEAAIMGGVGLLALAANVASALLLFRFREGDANIRSVWLCSRNDAIGNVAVVVAASGVWATSTAWPDLAVAAAMASLFFWSSVQILRRAAGELRPATGAEAAE